MKIDIIRNDYQASFFLNSKKIASSRYFSKKCNGYWILFNENNCTIAKVEIKKKAFRYNYIFKIYMYRNKEIIEDIELHYKNYKPHYLLNHKKDSYLIVEHNSGLISYFKNHVQIGYSKQEYLSSKSKTQFQLILNKNVDLNLLIILFHCVSCTDPILDGDLNINHKLIWPVYQEFDNSWTPDNFFN